MARIDSASCDEKEVFGIRGKCSECNRPSDAFWFFFKPGSVELCRKCSTSVLGGLLADIASGDWLATEDYLEEVLSVCRNSLTYRYAHRTNKNNLLPDINQASEELDYQAQVYNQQMERIGALKPLVSPYRHDSRLPRLPSEPAGALRGIGFIYDEDEDDRVLVAIEDFWHPDIVAVAEHKAVLQVFTRSPLNLGEIEVCCDCWGVEEFVPYRGGWKGLGA